MEVLAEKKEILDGMKPERKFIGFIGISQELIRSRYLSGSEKLLLSEMHTTEDAEKGCRANNKYFSEFIGLSISRCSHIINKLAKYGIISLKYTKENNSTTGRIIRFIVKDSEIDFTIANWLKENKKIY